MVKKLSVSVFISIVIAAIIYINKSDEVKKSKPLPLPQFNKIAKEASKKIKQSPCEVAKNVVSTFSEEPEILWENTYLEKDGIEYVLKLVQESNSQDQEIYRAKFYQLDEDGFPTPVEKNHNKVLGKEITKDELLKGYKVTTIKKFQSINNGMLFYETENDKIIKIKDHSINKECRF